MKKAIAVVLATTIAVSVAMIGCSKGQKKEEDTTSTTVDGLIGNEDTYEIVEEKVTNEKGEAVTDKNGNAVTTQVMYKETTDKKGNKVNVKIDDDGEVVTDKNHKPVTSKPKPTTTTTTTKAPQSTEPTSEVTTVPLEDDNVPKINDKTKPAEFNDSEKQIVKSMLEVPNLFKSNYENKDGVPIEAARHAAVWMAQREKLNTSTYASGTIVLGLFKFYGQTVVNFKNNCGSTPEITYNSKEDTFTIKKAENEVQTVTIEKVEEYAQKNNNNYYKITGSVSGCSKKKVVAVVQKNKLDNSLGFSIKAMRWS
ncbi:hypothetical protein [uncultured Eubacterium sp.]|uniref:hypothetical protein n=1 Tax=uncultured Eubacterium sp. TaxID=165185 RepID=UPI00262823A4|nr:hypothetical protein [uncultured Eubacterium sp.]